MSADNGVIRVGRKGRKKFAFGEDGAPFEVDVVTAFQQWVSIDEGFREQTEDRTIPTAGMAAYHKAAVEFVEGIANSETEMRGVDKQYTSGSISTAEALDFIARLREQYDEVSVFFRPKSLDEPDLPDTSGAEMRFSVEES